MWGRNFGQSRDNNTLDNVELNDSIIDIIRLLLISEANVDTTSFDAKSLSDEDDLGNSCEDIREDEFNKWQISTRGLAKRVSLVLSKMPNLQQRYGAAIELIINVPAPALETKIHYDESQPISGLIYRNFSINCISH